MHPEATVRPWATCQVIGDALSFASALGYVYVHADVPLLLVINSTYDMVDEGRRYINEDTSFGEAHWSSRCSNRSRQVSA